MKHPDSGVDMKLKNVLCLVTIALFVLSLSSPLAAQDGAYYGNSAVLEQQGMTVADTPEYLNVSEMWRNIYSAGSASRIQNNTRDLSEDYPDRYWFAANMSPSVNLEGAWEWANQTLDEYTEGDLSFEQITEYQHLIAMKPGHSSPTGPSIVLTGIIDSGEGTNANGLGASVCAVLEVARLLHNYTLGFNVYYVLLNGYFNDVEEDLSSRALVSWMEEQEIETITTLSFNRLLFHDSGYLYGTKTVLRSHADSGVYEHEQWIPDVMQTASQHYGGDSIISHPNYLVVEYSSAYEMWSVGRSAVYVSQGYRPDEYSETEDDTWDHPLYNYDRASDLTSAISCALTYVGRLSDNKLVTFYSSDIIYSGSTETYEFVLSHNGFVNVTVEWNSTENIETEILRASSSLVYARNESDGCAVLKYLSSGNGKFQLRLKSNGVSNNSYSFNITYLNDCDGDGLTDIYEVSIGTEVYSYDSDRDGLLDNQELSFGSDPLSSDSDGDGISDYFEYVSGSSIITNDTDLDGLIDPLEYDLGADPNNGDSDGDGIGDFEEYSEYHTDPTSSDTDLDGLEDGFEIEYGIDPLSPDSDGDSLSDLFEILNQLDPTSIDTDGDGWSDAYEVEFCLSPTNPDTDADGLPDSIDWDPQEHWVTVVAPITLLSIVSLLLVFAFLKWRVYKRELAAEAE